MISKKNKLLSNLKNKTYCRLGQSNIHGVGVFAIKDIPKNINPFSLTDNININYSLINISQNELDKLEKSVVKLIKDFIHPTDGIYAIPYKGMNSLDITFYLNHSVHNNLSLKISNSNDYITFYTNRLVKEGEELTINYSLYDKI